MPKTQTPNVDISRAPASALEVGDVIGTTRSNTRKAIEAAIAAGGAQDRGADGYSRGNGIAAIAKITDGPGGRIQARDGAGKMIRSMEPDVEVWRARAIQGTAAAAAPAPAKTAASLDEAIARITFKDAAEQVLRAGDGPMKVKQIAELAIPLVRPVPAGKTPAATLGAHLITDANKGGRFVKTAPGTFDVREINPRGAAKRPTARKAAPAPAADDAPALALVPDTAA